MSAHEDPHPTRRETPVGVQDLSDDEVADFLDGHDLAVLVFLHEDDPAGLRVRERVTRIALDNVAAAGFGAVDVRRHPLVADAIGVKSTPALLIFQGGRTVDRLMGAPPEDVIRDTVERRLRPRGTADSG